MQAKQFALMCCAGALLLVLVPASYAADAPADVAASADASSPPQPQVAAETAVDERMSSAPAKPAEKTAMATSTALPVETDPGRVYLIKDNPFFNLHIEKAVQHAREAEIAGNMGESALLLEHAKMSLMQAHEAQRAGNVAGLNEGIANLKQALNLPMTQTSAQASSTEMPQASIQTSAAEMPQASTQTSAAQVTGEKALSGTQRTEAAVRSATAHVREARKNLSEAGGLKFKEIQPQVATTVSADK